MFCYRNYSSIVNLRAFRQIQADQVFQFSQIESSHKVYRVQLCTPS
jgi:hypothetical protein